MGRRIAKQTPEGETRFIYDGARLLTEIKGEQQRTYVFEPGGFRPLACIDRQQGHGDAAVYYYQLDHLGTPREMTDSRGQIVWSGQYRAYGSLALADVAEVDNPLRFQGQYFDAETGLHYNLNRYYDPTLGRFISQDPIGLAGGTNLFQYAPNPVNWVDPLGLTGKDCGGDDYLYRGVSANHPALEEAKQGVVRPSNPNSRITPEQHAEGGLTGDSPYVSWTPNRELAEFHAGKDGPGGVVLKVPKGAPAEGDTWAWGWTHLNEWGEPEMLQTGTRTGLDVLKGD